MSQHFHQDAEAFLNTIAMDDDIQEALDDLVRDLANENASTEANTRPDSSDDERLHDAADALAASLNNQGPMSQIAWLLEQGCTTDWIRESIMDLPAPGTSGL